MGSKEDDDIDEFLSEVGAYGEPQSRDFSGVCVHDYDHLGCRRSDELREGAEVTRVYCRVDQFVCRRCLDFQTKKRVHEGASPPDWY
jgi:hypothetical protein